MENATLQKFRFVLDGREYFVRDENELALVFELLALTGKAGKYQWDVICSLDDDLLKIMETHHGLMRCARHLSNKNRSLLFLKIADNFSKVIPNATVFARLLASMPEEIDQEKFVKNARRKGLVAIVGKPSELGKVLEWATPAVERQILGYLEPSFVLHFQNALFWI